MNSVQSIADTINAFAGKFKITKEQVEVTSYEQMGENVRVFYKLNTTIGKTPEEIKKITQPIRLCNELMPDPFANETTDPEPEPDVKPDSITLDLVASAKVGETVNVAPVVLPEDAKDKTFTVEVSPEGIVEVMNGGAMLNCVAPGSVQVTVTSNASPAVKVVKVLAVEAATVAPRQLSLTGLATDLGVGATTTPIVAFDPTDTTNQDYTMETSNASVVTVTKNKVTAVGVGTANVVARSVADPSIVSTPTTITVKAPVIDPVSINLEVTSANFTGNNAEVNDSFKVSATVLPAGADQEVTYTVDPTGVVMDMGNNDYICEAEGTVTITATSVSKPSVKQTFVLNVAPDSPIDEG